MAQFVVTTQDDIVNASDGVVSLREAIAQAASSGDADTITFSQRMFTLGSSTIQLTQGQLQITQVGGPVTIQGDVDGNGNADVTIDAGGESRAMQITGASPSQQAHVTLDHLVITGGGTTDPTDTLSGAGISARRANLTVTGSTITDNHASASYSSVGTVGGGGIAVFDSTLSIENSNITANTGSDYNARGGAILAAGSTVTISDSGVSGNAAGFGGGISGYDSSITMTATTVADNSASGLGGGGRGGGLDIVGGEISIVESTVAENSVSTSQGGRAWVGYGGGIAASNGAMVTISGTTISGNSGTAGGGILGQSDADITVVSSTISDNVVQRGGLGGGLLFSGDTLTLTNTTVSGNTAMGYYYGGGRGGGIAAGGSVTITNSTIAGNAATVGYDGDPGDGGGLYRTGSGSFAVRNSIIAGNAAGAGSDISASIVSNGHNLFSQRGIIGSAAGDTIVAPEDVFTSVLGALADNGGPTLTHALLPGSVAIGGGLNADAAGPADQRGAPRIYDGTVDIGAFERAPLVIAGDGGSNRIEGSAANESISGLAGNDTVLAAGGNDTVLGGDGADSLDGMDGNDSVSGGAGNDTCRSGAGNDTVLGGAGNDLLTAGDGADSLNGGTGADTMQGGAGNDSFTVDTAGDVCNENAGGGTDTVFSSVSFTLGNNVENLTLTGGAAINGTGNGVANVLTGNGANNRLSGAAGADRLTGGVGADTLTGGAGNDTFDYNAAGESTVAAASRDTIAGFDGVGNAAGDRVDLADLFAGTLVFRRGAFTGVGQVHVVEDGATGNSRVEVNLIGSPAADFAILIQDGGVAASVWTQQDFLL